MGLFQSTQKRKVTRAEVTDLRGKFYRLSSTIRKDLPAIGIARNGGAVLLIASAAFMFLAISNKMWPLAGRLAGALVALALICHLIAYHLREGRIQETNRLLENFFDVVPHYMDTSNIPRQLKEVEFYRSRLIIDTVSLLVGFLFQAQTFSEWVLLAFILLGCRAVSLIRNIVETVNDFDLVNTCIMCASTLDKLITSCSERKENIVIDIEESLKEAAFQS